MTYIRQGADILDNESGELMLPTNDYAVPTSDDPALVWISHSTNRWLDIAHVLKSQFESALADYIEEAVAKFAGDAWNDLHIPFLTSERLSLHRAMGALDGFTAYEQQTDEFFIKLDVKAHLNGDREFLFSRSDVETMLGILLRDKDTLAERQHVLDGILRDLRGY